MTIAGLNDKILNGLNGTLKGAHKNDFCMFPYSAISAL